VLAELLAEERRVPLGLCRWVAGAVGTSALWVEGVVPVHGVDTRGRQSGDTPVACSWIGRGYTGQVREHVATALMTRRQVAVLAGCSAATVRRAEGKELRTQREALADADGNDAGSRVLILREDAEPWARRWRATNAPRPEVSHRRTDLREGEGTGVPAAAYVDGPTMAAALRMFTEGAEPVAVAIELQVALADVMAVWREYHAALQVQAPEGRLAELEGAVHALQLDAMSVPRDALGRRLDAHLPMLLQRWLPNLSSGLEAISRRLAELERNLP
jgi:hypothetical protein